jgi:hypothetical protein
MKDNVLLRREPFISPSTFQLTSLEVMATAIYFNNEACFRPDEISNVLTEGCLAPKGQSIHVMRFEIAPKQSFGASHFLAKLFRAIALDMGESAVRHSTTPLPALPRMGEGAGLHRSMRPTSPLKR